MQDGRERWHCIPLCVPLCLESVEEANVARHAYESDRSRTLEATGAIRDAVTDMRYCTVGAMRPNVTISPHFGSIGLDSRRACSGPNALPARLVKAEARESAASSLDFPQQRK